MSITLGLLAGGGALLGGLNAGAMNKALEEAQAEQVYWSRLAATYKYKTIENNANMTKALTREATQSAISEAMRAGSENVRQTQQAIEKGAGTMAAQQEGLAAGQSKGREMATYYLKGSKAIDQVQDQTQSAINQLITKQDQTTHAVNTELLNAYNSLSATLAYVPPKPVGQANRIFSGITSGLMSGLTLGSGFNAAKGVNVDLPSGRKPQSTIK